MHKLCNRYATMIQGFSFC